MTNIFTQNLLELMKSKRNWNLVTEGTALNQFLGLDEQLSYKTIVDQYLAPAASVISATTEYTFDFSTEPNESGEVELWLWKKGEEPEL